MSCIRFQINSTLENYRMTASFVGFSKVSDDVLNMIR